MMVCFVKEAWIANIFPPNYVLEDHFDATLLRYDLHIVLSLIRNPPQQYEPNKKLDGLMQMHDRLEAKEFLTISERVN